MREHKFRAWHRTLKEWHYFIIPYDMFQVWFWGGGKRIQPTGLDYDYWHEYTGLKDKNGKEIYEGDILSTLKSKRVTRMNKEYIVIGEYDPDIVEVQWRNSILCVGWSISARQAEDGEVIHQEEENGH